MGNPGVSAPSSYTVNYDALLSTTLFAYRPKMVDNIFKSSAFLAALRQYDGVEYQDGGERIQRLDDGRVKPSLIDLEAPAGATGRKQAEAVQRERLSERAPVKVMRQSELPHNVIYQNGRGNLNEFPA